MKFCFLNGHILFRPHKEFPKSEKNGVKKLSRKSNVIV